MRLFNRTSSLSFYLIHSGFKAFKARVKEELAAAGGGNLDDFIDDDCLHTYYRSGESPDFVAAALWNPVLEED